MSRAGVGGACGRPPAVAAASSSSAAAAVGHNLVGGPVDIGTRRRLFAGFRPLSGFTRARFRSNSTQNRSVSLPESNYLYNIYMLYALLCVYGYHNYIMPITPVTPAHRAQLSSDQINLSPNHPPTFRPPIPTQALSKNKTPSIVVCVCVLHQYNAQSPHHRCFVPSVSVCLSYRRAFYFVIRNV